MNDCWYTGLLLTKFACDRLSRPSSACSRHIWIRRAEMDMPVVRFLGRQQMRDVAGPRAHLVPQQPNHRMSRIQIGAVLVATTRPRKENMSTSIPLICVENEKSKMVDTAKRGDGQQRLNVALKRPLASQRSIDSSARDWRGFFREQIFRYKLCTLTSTLCRKCKERYNLTRYPP